LAIILVAFVGWWVISIRRVVVDGPPRFYHVPLGPSTNRARTEPTDGRDARRNLAEVPGTLRVDGVPFEIGPRYIQLAGQEQPGWPTEVVGIAVHGKAEKLHFLHGCANAFPLFGTRVATYTLHYDDGTSAELPVVTGRQLVELRVPGNYVNVCATRATTAWIGSDRLADEKGYRLQLFACCEENPHPGKTISRPFSCAPDARRTQPSAFPEPALTVPAARLITAGHGRRSLRGGQEIR
jgi:hypothetical protein